MNILYLISSLNYGGAEKQIVNDYREMKKSESKVFISYFTEGPLLSKTELTDRKKISKKYLSGIIQVANFIKINSIDFVHASIFKAIIIGTIAAMLNRKTQIIWHMHSHEYNIPLKSRIVYRFLSRSSKVYSILFVSNEQYNYYFAKKMLSSVTQKKSKIFYNNCTIPVKRRRNNGSRLIIGFLGRVVPLKRVHYLVELAHYLKSKSYNNFKIIIAGDGPDLGQIKKNVIETGVQNYFDFLGFTDKIDRFYSSINVFINPSKEECLSISMIDAKCSGVPIIAFNVGGNSEIVQNKENGFIINSTKELNKAIEFFYLNPEKRKQMGEHALSKSELFDDSKRLIKLSSLYNQRF